MGVRVNCDRWMQSRIYLSLFLSPSLPPSLFPSAKQSEAGSTDQVISVPSVMDHQKPNIFAASSGLDDFEEGFEEEMAEAQDFADEIRGKIADEHKRTEDVAGFEVSKKSLAGSFILLLFVLVCEA